MLCTSCSRELPEGARFCPSCGQPANFTVDPGDDERRVVTVLFADLVGFTSLSEGRDPEQVKRLIDSAFELLVADVEDHGGVVDKLLGDAIVALFGAPVAHEDDAERAVRAGLAMQETLTRFATDNPADELRMRIGVNTGEVLMGTLAGTDYTAMGDVVNTAARLQELARPGSVLVGDDTKVLCSTALRFQSSDRVRLRGREQKIQTWRVTAHDPLLASRRWESDVPFVGRVTELELLGSVVELVRSGRSAMVSLTGEAGIGKSRVVSELLAGLVEAEPDTTLLEGACAPYGESNVWWPVAGGALRSLGLHRNASPDEARKRVEERLPSIVLARPGTAAFERAVELTMHLLGHPSALDKLGPAATRDSVFSGLSIAIQRRSDTGPVVIWLEDLQWAAPLLLDLLEFIAQSLSNLPVLIITTSRPVDDDPTKWPPAVDPGISVHLSVGPLDESESAEVVGVVVGHEMDAGVAESISTRSGGNPLFLIELARLAANSGSDGSELPGSMRALIAARLDQLTPGQRAVLDNAAIIGTEGDTASLVQFADELSQDFDIADLENLESRGLMLRVNGRWTFRSDVVREVAYDTLTKQARAQRHAGVARFLASEKSGAIDRRAHHTASAAEIVVELGAVAGVPDDVDVIAISLLTQATQRWFLQGAYRRGMRTARRALLLAENDTDETRCLLLLLAEGLIEIHDHDLARTVLTDTFEAAEEAGDRVTRGEVHRRRGQIAQVEGDLVAARRDYGLAVDEFRDLGNEKHLADALRGRGLVEAFGGSLVDGDRFLAEAQEIFEQIGDRHGNAWVHQHRAWVSFLAGDHDESLRRLETALESFEEFGDRSGKTWSLGLLAYVHHFGRRNDEALELSTKVLEEARRWGDDWGASMMLNLQATIRLWSGDPEKARLLAGKSLDGFRKIDDRFGMIQALATRNRAFVALGSVSEAERSSEEILSLSDSFGDLAYPAMAAAGTAMHLGRGRRAIKLGREATERLDATGANIEEARVVIAFGHLLAGDSDAALAELLEVDVESSPYALAARATARASVGDFDGAFTDAELVDAMESVSYWDRAIALVAGTASASGRRSSRWRKRLHELVDTVDDAVVHGYAQAVLAGLEGDTPDAPHLLGGWKELAETLTAERDR